MPRWHSHLHWDKGRLVALEIMAGLPLIRAGFAFSAAGSRGRTCRAAEPIPLWQQHFPHLESHLETATGFGNVVLEGNLMAPLGISLSLWMWLWLLGCGLARDGQCSPWE